MTVGELIAELQKYDAKLPVVYYDYYELNIDTVSKRTVPGNPSSKEEYVVLE